MPKTLAERNESDFKVIERKESDFKVIERNESDFKVIERKESILKVIIRNERDLQKCEIEHKQTWSLVRRIFQFFSTPCELKLQDSVVQFEFADHDAAVVE